MQASKLVQASTALFLAVLGLTLIASGYLSQSENTTVLISSRGADSKNGRFLSGEAANDDLSSYFRTQAVVEKNKHGKASKHGESAHNAQREVNSYFANQALRAEGRVPSAQHQKGKLTLIEDDHNSYPAPRSMQKSGTEYGLSTRASRSAFKHDFGGSSASKKHGHTHMVQTTQPHLSTQQADKQIADYFSNMGQGLKAGKNKKAGSKGKKQKKAFIGVGPEDKNAEEVGKALGIDKSYFTPVTPPQQSHVDEANQAIEEQRGDHYTNAEDIKLPPS